MKKVVKTKCAGPKAEQLLVSNWRILEASEEFGFSNLILGLIGFYMEKFIYVIASPFFSSSIIGKLGQDFHMLQSVRI